MSLGKEHPTVADTLNDLAVALGVKGQIDAAEELFRQALAIRRKSLAHAHPDVARSLHNLAQLLFDKGEYDEAERLYREALAIRRKSLGDAHPYVAPSFRGLASACSAKGDLEEAERLCREALAIHREPADVDDGLLAILGYCLLKKAQHAEAEPVLRECPALREKKNPENWSRYNTMSMLGEALCGQGKHAEAEALLVEGYEKMAPPEPLTVRKREALERIVKLYEAWGKPEKAAEWRAKR
jgi:tetratricopeptide (TPR) repeat protein